MKDSTKRLVEMLEGDPEDFWFPKVLDEWHLTHVKEMVSLVGEDTEILAGIITELANYIDPSIAEEINSTLADILLGADVEEPGEEDMEDYEDEED